MNKSTQGEELADNLLNKELKFKLDSVKNLLTAKIVFEITSAVLKIG